MAYHNPHYSHQRQQHPSPAPASAQQQHFTAELEAPQRAPSSDAANRIPVSPDGGPIFEMSADPAPVKESENSGVKGNAVVGRPGRGGGEEGELGTPTANPWPYHGPAGGEDEKEMFSPTVTGSGSWSRSVSVSQEQVGSNSAADPTAGPDVVAHGHRQSSVASAASKSAPADDVELMPPPLSIRRPQPPTKSYMAYNPAQTDAGSAEVSSAEGTQSTMPYRPYRRPSFVEHEAEAQKSPISVVPAGVVTPTMSSSTGLASAESAPSSPPLPPPMGTAGLPYPDGMASHHFRMPSPPLEPPAIPHESRPANLMPDARPATAGGMGQAGRPHSKSSPGPPPPSSASMTLPANSMSPGPSVGRPEEIVLWPPRSSSTSGLDGGLASQVPAPQNSSYPQSAPTSTVSSPVSAPQHAPTFQPPPPPQQPAGSLSTLSFVPQPTYSSSPAQPPPPPHSSSGLPQSPQATSPQSPPPPYSQAFPVGVPPPSLPPEKPSIFPHHAPPPSSSMLPTQQQGPYPAQPMYATGLSSQPSSALPSPQGPPSPYQSPSLYQPPSPYQPSSPYQQPSPHQHPSPHGTAPPSPYQYPQYGQSTPPLHGQPTYAQPPPQHPYPPHHQHSTPPMYSPPTQQYGGTGSLVPPPLPPRPSSAHSYGPPPAQGPPHMGFSAGPATPVAAYPRPPKTHYTPGSAGANKPPGPPHGFAGRPSLPGPGNNKLFGSTVAKKWLDKTGQLVENKIEEMLQNHPDPKYRQQQGAPPLPPNYPQQQQPPQQQYPQQYPQQQQQQQQQPQQYYPPQQSSTPYDPPNTYQSIPQHPQAQYAHRGGHGYGAAPPGP